ncbi:hypothetical protein [Emticicia sp. C21]|uniref:hypothetical protein n=1 Tax=Emticicia sp. C21 TaxID=2302915 RepID=UPI000E34CF34|nr:hypothetical protein [Emticicia sp. C21]RFS15513.1 hypothetical protein D0T08_15295 [Emticicia sp. C21]
MKTIYHINRIFIEQKSSTTKNYMAVFAVFCLFLLNIEAAKAQNPSVSMDSKGVLVPRMTAAQRSPGIAAPATGLLVYQTDGASGFYYNAGTPNTPNWVRLTGEPSMGLGSAFFTSTVNPDTPGTRQVPIPYSPTNVVTIMPAAANCTAIYLETETVTAAPVSSSTATLYKNGNPTALTVIVNSGANIGDKVVGLGTGSIAVAAGDKLTIGVSSANPAKYIKMNVSLNCK